MGNRQMIYNRFGTRLRLAFTVLAIALAVFIAVSSLVPAQPSLSVNHMDKLLHIMAYLTLGAATFPVFPRLKPVLTWLGLCGFGVVIEVLQGAMSNGRSTDILDGFANASGALLALLAWVALSRLIRQFS